MGPRGTDAIPLPPRPNLEHYRNRAKSLVKACQSGDAALRTWATQWLESLAALHDGTATSNNVTENVRHLRWSEVDREFDHIARDARDGGLLNDDAPSTCTLSDAQLFLARLHDFVSWPKFAKHVEAMARASSPDSEFEAAADVVVMGDLAVRTAML